MTPPAGQPAPALGGPPPSREQAAVIEAPLRPLLVVAGAGSGKTETMASRVVWLVANGHVEPDQVLGLTFTRKAASELSDRIGRRLRQLQRVGLWTPSRLGVERNLFNLIINEGTISIFLGWSLFILLDRLLYIFGKYKL